MLNYTARALNADCKSLGDCLDAEVSSEFIERTKRWDSGRALELVP